MVSAHTHGLTGINTWDFGFVVKGTDWVFIPVEMGLFMWEILWITCLKETVPLSMSKEILIPVNGNLASKMVEVAVRGSVEGLMFYGEWKNGRPVFYEKTK